MSDELLLHTDIERWPLCAPFRFGPYTYQYAELLVVRLEQGGHSGLGEAAGVHFLGETPTSMLEQVCGLREAIAGGVTHQELRDLLPAGGARNAVDCALWDLKAQISGKPVWQLAALSAPEQTITTFTCGAGDPADMAGTALSYANASAIKIKLLGDDLDIERVHAIRNARPSVWLGVDGNQLLTRDALQRLLPTLEETNVALIEQPFPAGRDYWLDGIDSRIAFAADESATTSKDLPGLAHRYQVANIKLDKCGGFTEALEMVRTARALGLRPMVGCMMGTSLAMAPAILLAQLCELADLDAPTFLTEDRANGAKYQDGHIAYPSELWGSPRQ